MGLICLFPPCFILIHFVSLISVPFPTYNEFIISTEPTHVILPLNSVSFSLDQKYSQVSVPALSDPPFLCGRMGWGHSSIQWLCAKRGKSGGLCRPSFYDQNTKINCFVSMSQEFLLFIDQRWNDESTNIIEFFLLSTNPIKTSMIYKLNLLTKSSCALHCDPKTI